MKDLENPKRIRALDRGLAVIEFLSRNGQSTLADLRHSTGLSNATLLRVLGTLADRRWIRRNIAEGKFELAHSLGDILGKTARAHPLAEIAAPYLVRMASLDKGFPSDICTMLAPGKIEIIESTRIKRPLDVARSTLGIRPSMFMSSHGRVMLAFMSDSQFKVHFEALRTSATREEKQFLDQGRFEKVLKETRALGYARREPGYWVQSGFDTGPDMDAIALPLLCKRGLFGSLSLTWLHKQARFEDVLATGGLQDLKRTTEELVSVLEVSTLTPPLFSE